MPTFDDVPIVKDGERVAQALGTGGRVSFRCADANCLAQLLFKADGEGDQVERCPACGAEYRLVTSPEDGRIVGLEML
jgi:hypothetical protein